MKIGHDVQMGTKNLSFLTVRWRNWLDAIVPD